MPGATKAPGAQERGVKEGLGETLGLGEMLIVVESEVEGVGETLGVVERELEGVEERVGVAVGEHVGVGLLVGVIVGEGGEDVGEGGIVLLPVIIASDTQRSHTVQGHPAAKQMERQCLVCVHAT